MTDLAYCPGRVIARRLALFHPLGCLLPTLFPDFARPRGAPHGGPAGGAGGAAGRALRPQRHRDGAARALSLNRATLFRTLRLLEQKQLIHRVADYTETVRFAAAPTLRLPAAAPPLPAAHVHLKCSRCQHLCCLPQVPVPAVPEASAYQVTHRECLLLGICASCQAALAGPGA